MSQREGGGGEREIFFISSFFATGRTFEEVANGEKRTETSIKWFIYRIYLVRVEKRKKYSSPRQVNQGKRDQESVLKCLWLLS